MSLYSASACQGHVSLACQTSVHAECMLAAKRQRKEVGEEQASTFRSRRFAALILASMHFIQHALPWALLIQPGLLDGRARSTGSGSASCVWRCCSTTPARAQPSPWTACMHAAAGRASTTGCAVRGVSGGFQVHDSRWTACMHAAAAKASTAGCAVRGVLENFWSMILAAHRACVQQREKL